MLRQRMGAVRVAGVVGLAILAAGLAGCASSRPEVWVHAAVVVDAPVDSAGMDDGTLHADVGLCLQRAEFRSGLMSRSTTRGPVPGLGSRRMKVVLGQDTSVMAATEFRGLPPVVVPVGDDYIVCPAVGELAYCQVVLEAFDPQTRTGRLRIRFIASLTMEDPFRTVTWYLPEEEVSFEVNKPIAFSSVLPAGGDKTVGAVRNRALESVVQVAGVPGRKVPFISITADRLPGEDEAELQKLVRDAYNDRVAPLADWPTFESDDDDEAAPPG